MTQVPGGAASIRTSSPVLVGRAHELEAMLDPLRRQSTVVLIEGEAGVGKTRLVRELLEHPDLERIQAMVGHCQPLRDPFPFGAVVEAVRSLAGRVRPGLNPVVGALRPLLPELDDVLPPSLEPVGDPHAERHRLLRATRELFAALGPALLVVEDLHWADDSTRQMLRFVMADPPPNLSVVVTYRREDLAGDLPLGAAYRPPDGVASVVLRLRPLGVDEVRTLAAAILDADTVAAEFATVLHHRTAGVPFVVEELLRSHRMATDRLDVDGDAARHLLDGAEVPILLRDAMADRLASLPALARRLVEAAAVLDVPSRLEQLAEVAGIGAGPARLALAEAVRGGVLYETEPACYGLRHALAQQAVYDTLDGPARQQLHLRAIATLERLDPRPLVQLAEHGRRAGRTAQWLRYGEAAADLATIVGDASTATRLLQHLLDELPLPGPDVNRLAAKLGRAAYGGLDQHDPLAALDRLLHDQRLSAEVRGEVRLYHGLLLIRQHGSLKAARTEIARAVSDLGERSGLAAKGAAVLGQTFVGSTPLEECERWMAVADRQLRHSTDPELRISLLANLLGSRLHVGDPGILGDLSALPETVDTPGQERQLARARCNLADACTSIGRFEQAAELLQAGLRTAATAGSPFVLSTAQSTQVRLDWYRGAWSGLDERAAQLLADYRDLLPVASELSLVLGLLATARGEWSEAESYLVASGVDTPDDAIAPIAVAGYAGLVTLCLAQDEPARAAGFADRGRALLRHKRVWTWAGDLAPPSVAAWIASGRGDTAREFVAETADGLTGRDAPLADAALEQCRAQLAAADADLAAAYERFRSAEARYARLPAPYPATLAAEQAVACRLASGDRTAADELARLAETLDRLGASRDAGRCRHELRSRGGVVPSRRGRRGYGNELSPREQDVVRLVSRGLTNREIAEILFLSPRTVEQHVAKALHKLGVESRTELTRMP